MTAAKPAPADAAEPGSEGWRPAAGTRALQLRARLNTVIRQFFAAAGVMEVETPCWSAAANTDPNIQSLPAGTRPAGFLRTSPEFAMKRLLCAGSGPIYELGRVFRESEAGRFHNGEFTMLEWYRPGFSLARLMTETSALIALALAAGGQQVTIVETDFARLIEDALQVEPLGTSDARLLEAARAACDVDGELQRSECLDLLLDAATRQLPADQLTLVRGFPACQAALARLDPAEPRCALRFEAFIGAVEVANGYDELRDADELQRRMDDENRRRRAAGRPPMPVDRNLVAALQAGLPPCCGVSVGVDRLLMCAGRYAHIDQVLAFPGGRA